MHIIERVRETSICILVLNFVVQNRFVLVWISVAPVTDLCVFLVHLNIRVSYVVENTVLNHNVISKRL